MCRSERIAPTELLSLAEVIAAGPEDQEPASGFVANLHGEIVEVTAVLERAVVAPLGPLGGQEGGAAGRPAGGPGGDHLEAEGFRRRPR